MIRSLKRFYGKGFALPKKTDSGNPLDWLYYVEVDLEAVRLLCEREIAYLVCKSKLAEAFEKALKADLINRGWEPGWKVPAGILDLRFAILD